MNKLHRISFRNFQTFAVHSSWWNLSLVGFQVHSQCQLVHHRSIAVQFWIDCHSEDHSEEDEAFAACQIFVGSTFFTLIHCHACLLCLWEYNHTPAGWRLSLAFCFFTWMNFLSSRSNVLAYTDFPNLALMHLCRADRFSLSKYVTLISTFFTASVASDNSWIWFTCSWWGRGF